MCPKNFYGYDAIKLPNVAFVFIHSHRISLWHSFRTHSYLNECLFLVCCAAGACYCAACCGKLEIIWLLPTLGNIFRFTADLK